jgi:hypothetical protein
MVIRYVLNRHRVWPRMRANSVTLTAGPARAAYWVLPSLFCIVLYWHGLKSWFQLDDFVWLGLRRGIHGWGDLWHAVFSPAEHGTFRPFSERGFFLLFQALFGQAALPFRIWVFLTQFLNLALISSITRRITGSGVAGFLAPVFWVANSSLFVVMTWSSAYMQVLCGLCLLLAFHFLLRYIETDDRRYYLLQWAVFLFGFGVMETNLVYPALAGLYTFLFARRYFRSTLPLAIPSIVFVALHMAVAPKQPGGPYAMHFDGAIAKTVITYWRAALEPNLLAAVAARRAWIDNLSLALFTTALSVFTVWSACRKQWVPMFFLGWFAITLAPVAPLRDHIMKYYLTLPTMGLAMLGACAVSCAWQRGIAWKALAVLLVAAYFMGSIPACRRSTDWWYGRSQAARTLVRGVVGARELHPDKTILLAGVDDYLFWAAISDGAFRAFGVEDVYLTPGSESQIYLTPELADLPARVFPKELAARELERERVVVYSVGGARLKNVTLAYKAVAESGRKSDPLRRVDVAEALESYRLGPGWYSIEHGHRWMGKRASLRIGGPRSAGERLYITGACPEEQVRQGPLGLTVTIDGAPLPAVKIFKEDPSFHFDFAFPASAIGKSEVEVSVEVSRTLKPAGLERRALGLAFGIFEIK